MGFALGVMIVLGLIGYVVKYVQQSAAQERMQDNGIKSYEVARYIGGHPYFTPNDIASIEFYYDNKIGIHVGTRRELIPIKGIEACEVETSEQIKNNATLVKTLVFGLAALKDSVSEVQYMRITYRLEGQSVTCLFRADSKLINKSTGQADTNIARTAFEIKKLMNAD